MRFPTPYNTLTIVGFFSLNDKSILAFWLVSCIFKFRHLQNHSNLNYPNIANMKDVPKINCTRCKHYMVTWDLKHPKGCKLFNVKSSRIPAQVVYEATSMQCEHYCEKIPVKS